MNRFAILEAYWLFGSENHGGQFTKEYAYMVRAERCGFRPSPILCYQTLSEEGQMIYDNLAERMRDSKTIVPIPIEDLPGSLPEDYEACGDCQFDHAYEAAHAHRWHTENPGSYDTPDN